MEEKPQRGETAPLRVGERTRALLIGTVTPSSATILTGTACSGLDQADVGNPVSRQTQESSDALWASRPRESQLASIASEQSRPVDSRAALEHRIAEVDRQFDGLETVTRPSWWGAMRVVPRSIEFWQGRTSRIHDRLRYTATGDGGWGIERLQP